MEKGKSVLGLLRLGVGWMFLWSFIDKLFGFGLATAPDNAWLAGGSPTYGYLTHATKGPFAEFFQGLAGNATVDWLFMLGILFIGVSLLLGIFTRLASLGGMAMMVLFYVSGFMPPEHNPFFDEHVLYFISLLLIYKTVAGRWLGVGTWWANNPLVAKYPILK